jgi:hypothetical protein
VLQLGLLDGGAGSAARSADGLVARLFPAAVRVSGAFAALRVYRLPLGPPALAAAFQALLAAVGTSGGGGGAEAGVAEWSLGMLGMEEVFSAVVNRATAAQEAALKSGR